MENVCKNSGTRKYYVTNHHTQQCGQMGNTHVTHTGLGLNLGPEEWLVSWCYAVLLSPSRQIPGHYLKLHLQLLYSTIFQIRY